MGPLAKHTFDGLSHKALLILIVAIVGSAAVVDRIAVVVGKTIITESEVLQELRLTALQNNEPLQLGPDQRRAAAERLVDQQLIRKEMQTGGYAEPAGEEVETLLGSIRRQQYPSESQYREALARYGVTEEELKNHLRWQLEALRFTEVRFQTNLPDTPGNDSQSANRTENNVDRQLEDWLKEARSQTRIQFKKEAFQ